MSSVQCAIAGGVQQVHLIETNTATTCYNVVQHGTTNERGAPEIEGTQHSTYIRNIPCTHHDTSSLVLPLLYSEIFRNCPSATQSASGSLP